MGHFTVLLGLVLLASTGQALRCLQGTVHVDDLDRVTSSQVEEVDCEGVCVTNVADVPKNGQLHMLSCQQAYRKKKMHLGDRVCKEDFCNAVQGTELGASILAASPSPNIVGPGECYVGLKHGDYSVGGTELCDGDCGTFSTLANGKISYLFFCAPRPLCQGFLKSDDGTIVLDGNVNGSCCSTGPNCNADGLVSPMPPLSTDFRPPIACFSGITFQNKFLTPGGYVACQGDCSSLQYKLQSNFTFTIYGCDPGSVCKGFGLQNKCANIDDGTFYGCCCDTDDCIDPTLMPPVSPDNPVPEWIECYAGVHMKYTDHNFDAGGEAICHGYCGSAVTKLNSTLVTAFFCADESLCNQLEAHGTCDQVTIGDQELLVCCCNDEANCNIKGRGIPTPASPTVIVPQMIACYQGLWVNNQSMSDGDFTACAGDCASITLPTTMNNKPFEVTLFSCDPATVCRGLGLINNCATIDNTISGCCCDTDVCINPMINKYPNGNYSDDLSCFTGLVVGNPGTDSYSVIGGALPCQGECAYFKSNYTGMPAAGYFCAPRSLCHRLGVHNDCAYLPGSNATSGCCCDWADNCNAVMENVTVPTSPPPNRSPLACYSGLSYNGTMLQDADRYMTCRGDCGSLTFTTTIGGKPHSLTMYSCDPTNMCAAFKLKDSCAQVGKDDGGNSLSGCCCSWNDCLDLGTGQIKPTHDNLQCFVGTAVNGDKGSMLKGQSAPCSGKCGSIQTTINKAETWSFFCASTKACSLVESDTSHCATLFNDNMEYIRGCCCDDSNNCNIHGTDVDVTIAPPTSIPDNRSPIACYSGISMNGGVLTDADSYLACHGDCASVSYHSTFNGKSVVTTIYSCDPAAYCRDLGMSNSCANIDSTDSTTTIYGCCCDWDDCIDTNNNGMIKPHDNNNTRPDNLECVVGYSIDFGGDQGDQFYGSAMPCDGSCASVEITVAGMYMTGYLCAPNNLCTSLDVKNSCAGLAGQHNILGCCCDNAINCNNRHNLTVPPYTPPTKSPIACYSGLAVNGQLLTDANQYMACQGDCGLFNFHTKTGDFDINVTMFSCDGVSVCDSLGLKDSCSSLGTVIDGCCCGFNDCLDISKRQVKPNHDTLKCFVGLGTSGLLSSTYGDSESCSGQCSSVQTSVKGQNTWGFFCAPDALCDALNKTNGCQSVHDQNGKFVRTCCCNDANNCNLNNSDAPPAPTALPPAPASTPIACYSGISLNGQQLGPDDAYSACFGECTSLSYWTRLFDNDYVATIFTCDPIQLCNHYAISGDCATILGGDSTISGCCCDFDDCIDKKTGGIKKKQQDLQQCFVGLASEGSNVNMTYGQSLPCDGQCGLMASNFNGHEIYGFYCASNKFCNSLNLTNHCMKMFADGGTYLEACCCSNSDNCNLNNLDTPINPPPSLPPPSYHGAPITCFSGISINGVRTTAADSFQTCYGECFSMTYQLNLLGKNYAATLFTCDPSEMCDHFGISGSCATLLGEQGSNAISGCCCNWNDCLDWNGKPKSTNVTHRPDNLACVVGASYKSAGADEQLLGSSMRCDGSCISVETSVNNVYLTGYYCVEPSLCTKLDMTNKCNALLGDQYAKGCCCDTGDNCNNVNNLDVHQYTPPMDPPLACYSGLSINGAMQSDANSYMACQGKCGLLSFTTVVGDKSYDFTLFGCEPVDVCDQLGLKDSCNKIVNGMIQGCCCGWSDCIDREHKSVKPSRDTLQCFSGIATEGSQYNSTIGTAQACDGQCASIASSINNQATWVFFCASNKLCDALNMTNHCDTLFTDNQDYLEACCCNDDDQCNVNNAHVDPAPTLPPPPSGVPPITCYNGLSINGNLLTAGNSYQACFGDCSAITYHSVFLGKSVTTTVYACDPASLCSQLGMDSKCANIQSGNTSTTLYGCCCTYNDCIDLSNGMVSSKFLGSMNA
ncbi:unnamed protein product, partial [Mesorhabditis belari]|uniref:Uncharacterized protein n=1 Tax=Mesorhabditis belari TaxID=2138241 RepID=A0AAF3FR41_9BILA